MPTTSFQSRATDLALSPCPITPEWIHDGAPVARAAELSRSADGTTQTVVWDCTAGSFTWTYGVDETIHIIEGSIVLQDGGNAPTRLGPGDSVFFPKGAQVHWTVETYVKKIAFLRRVVPNPLMKPYKLLKHLKSIRPRLLSGAAQADLGEPSLI